MTYKPFPPVDGAPAAAAPTEALQVGGTDGTNLRALSTDTGGRLNVRQPNQILLATTAESLTATVTSVTKTATVDAQGCIVTMEWTDTAKTGFPSACRLRNTTSGVWTEWQPVGILQPTTGYATLYFTLPVANGDTVVIDLIATGTLTASKMNVTAELVPQAPGFGDWSLTAYQSLYLAPSTVLQNLQAAVSGWSAVVVSAFFTVNAGAGGPCQGSINGTYNGNTTVLAAAAAPTSGTATAAQNFPGHGIRLDPNAAVTVQTASTPTTGYSNLVWAMVPNP